MGKNSGNGNGVRKSFGAYSAKATLVQNLYQVKRSKKDKPFPDIIPQTPQVQFLKTC